MHVELEGPVQHAMDTEDELEGSVASGGGWHGAGGRGRGVGGGSGARGQGGRAGGASAARNGHGMSWRGQCRVVSALHD